MISARKIVILFMLGCSQELRAQFTYFDNLYNPPEYVDSNSGVLWNLFVLDSEILCTGSAYHNYSYGHWFLKVDDSAGAVLENIFIPYENFQMLYTWGDTYDMNSVGHVLGTHFVYSQQDDVWPTYAFEFNTSDLTMNCETIGSDYANDSTVYSQLIVRELGDFSVLACGTVQHFPSDFNFQLVFCLHVTMEMAQPQAQLKLRYGTRNGNP